MPGPTLPPHGSLPRVLFPDSYPHKFLINQVVEGGGFEPPKLARQIYSLIPLATREPLLKYPKGQNPWLYNSGPAFYWNWEGCAIV